MEISHQRRAEFLTDGKALVGSHADDPALDIEQGIEPLHRFERDRIDHPCLLAAALFAGCTLDIGKLEELAARVREAACFEHGTGLASVAVELAISAIGVGLQDA